MFEERIDLKFFKIYEFFSPRSNSFCTRISHFSSPKYSFLLMPDCYPPVGYHVKWFYECLLVQGQKFELGKKKRNLRIRRLGYYKFSDCFVVNFFFNFYLQPIRVDLYVKYEYNRYHLFAAYKNSNRYTNIRCDYETFSFSQRVLYCRRYYKITAELDCIYTSKTCGLY